MLCPYCSSNLGTYSPTANANCLPSHNAIEKPTYFPFHNAVYQIS